MNLDDIVYIALLIGSICFGYIYRQIVDVNQKKIVGSVIGFFIIFTVSGFHILHPIITILVNSIIILFLDKRQCHLISFGFSFLYLLFFRNTVWFGIPYPPAHTNLVQMMLTLKLVGLAFEVNSAYNAKKKKDEAVKTIEEKLEAEENSVDPNFIDIIHYSLNYAGVLTGPYFRYKTFMDFLHRPYSKNADWKQATIDKLIYVPLFIVGFLFATYNWPLSYALTDEFYERSWLYRYWYIWPAFFIFRMRIYIGLVLSECVCTMIGLGAYPAFTKPKSGQGPSENFQKLKELTDKDLEKEKFDFETVHNVNPYNADFCPSYREAIKNWNICIQYWLAVNVYKRFPNKKYRTAVTMLVSAFWHGVYMGYYVCIGTVPFVLAIEDIYSKLYLKDCKEGKGSKIYEWIHWFFRMHFFSYQAIAFLLLEVGKIMHFYNSIYHAGLILGIVLYIIGLQLKKLKRSEQPKKID